MTMLVKTVGFSLLQRSIAKKMNKLRHREAVNQQATVVVDKWIQENFRSQGRLAMGGAGWRPLSDQTLARRRTGAAGFGAKILVDTGQLKSRWKHLWTATLAKVQSGVDYARQHHFGQYFLPVRRILPSDDQIWPRIEKLYNNYIRKVLK
jgi:phage gpG-like protein